MIQLTPQQAEDLHELQTACESFAVDLVIIGATAYRVFLDDPYRTTEDVDIAIALDLDGWPEFTSDLVKRGWKQRQNLEHRWRGPHGSLVDIIPAGSKLRGQGRLVWPRSEMTMSLVGFNHVFADSIEHEFAPDLRIKVVPLPVLALLKILAYMDNPHARQKDIEDFVEILQRYEQDGERRFCDAVFDAGVSFDDAGAFLLGTDFARLCTSDESLLVENFIAVADDDEHPTFAALRRWRPRTDSSNEVDINRLFRAFTLGLHGRG